jgi:undecaprenyl-phosphate galactose phosphotransferase
MRPGITGWWACNGRNALNYTDRLNLEYYYVDNASLLLDLKCIFKTIEAVVKKTGVE